MATYIVTISFGVLLLWVSIGLFLDYQLTAEEQSWCARNTSCESEQCCRESIRFFGNHIKRTSVPDGVFKATSSYF